MATAGLRQWNLSPRTSVRLLNLSENATYGLVDPSSGRQWVLRLHRVGYSSAEEIRLELAWIDALIRERVIDTAAPLVGSDGDPVQVLHSPSGGVSRHAVIFERLPGTEPVLSADSTLWFGRARATDRALACARALVGSPAAVSTQALGR